MDKRTLDNRLRELGLYSEYYHRLELKTLAGILQVDEKLNCILTGIYDGSRRLLAVTDSKIYLINAGPFVQTNFIVIKRKAVKSWDFQKKFLTSSLRINTGEATYEVLQTQGKREALFNRAMSEPIKEYDE